MKERFEVITFRYFRTIYEIRKSSGYISSSDGTDGPRVDGSRERNKPKKENYRTGHHRTMYSSHWRRWSSSEMRLEII